MPDIKPLNLPKFPPIPPRNQERFRSTQQKPEKNITTNTYKTNRKHKKQKTIDKSIIGELITQNTHLRNIRNEQ